MRAGKNFVVAFLILIFLAATAVAQENAELTGGVVMDPNGDMGPKCLGFADVAGKRRSLRARQRDR